MTVKHILKEWFKRYALAELIALILALVFSNLSKLLFGNFIIAGFIATWADNFGFYGTIVYNDFQSRRISKQLGIKDYFILLRNMIIEFGPAEYLDSFLIRPFYLSFFPHIMSNYSLGIFVGTILANITYYIPTIISYETRKELFKN